GHGDMQVAAAAFELDVDVRHHHHLGGTHDIRQVRVDLRIHVLELQRHHRRPGLLEVLERVPQDDLDHARLGGREFTALDLRLEAPVSTEEIVHHGKHELRVENEQRRAAQRLDAHQVEAGGHIEAVDVFGELDHLHA